MSKEKSALTLATALNAALADEMSEDPMVVVFGEDVGTLGGVFRITEGLAQQFGDDRCFDTPLAESGIAGTAIGMALGGVRRSEEHTSELQSRGHLVCRLLL